MRTQIDNSVLTVVVNLICDTLDTFSAYDVTTLVRARLPQYNILHEDVRALVLTYVQANKLSESDNGTYRVFSKPKSFASTPTSNVRGDGSSKIVYDDREDDDVSVSIGVPVAKITSKVTSATNSLVDEMKNMINGFGKVGKTSTKVVPPNARTQKVSTSPVLTRLYNLQSENRLTLPIDVFNKLSTKSGRYTVNRTQNKITIVPETNSSLTGGKIRAGQRFRTLFANTVRMVNVSVYSDRIEIVPN